MMTVCYFRGRTEKGAAILTITIILLLVATIAALFVGRVGLFEQKAVATDVRSKEVYSAAIGGLEYGIKYFKDNTNLIQWTCGGSFCTDTDDAFVGSTATPPAVPRSGGVAGRSDLRADNYTHTVTYTMKSQRNPVDVLKGNPRVVTVTSTAVGAADSHVRKTVQADILWGLVPTFGNPPPGVDSGILDSPPIVVEGCFNTGGVTGTPDIFPTVSSADGIAITTTQGLADGTSIENCLNPGHFELCVEPGGNANCYDPEVYSEMTQEPYRASLDPPASLWSTIFGEITESDLRAMERRDPAQVMVVDKNVANPYPRYAGQPGWNSGSSTWTASVGTEDNPVILYFDSTAGCPGTTGTLVVWGIVYIEQPNCNLQGMGAVEIYGTLAQSGNLVQLSANTQVHGVNLDFGTPGTGSGGTGTIDDPPSYSARITVIPGSWRDFVDADF